MRLRRRLPVHLHSRHLAFCFFIKNANGTNVAIYTITQGYFWQRLALLGFNSGIRMHNKDVTKSIECEILWSNQLALHSHNKSWSSEKPGLVGLVVSLDGVLKD